MTSSSGMMEGFREASNPTLAAFLDQIYHDAVSLNPYCEGSTGADVVDPGGLKEAAAFKRIRLLCFLYFCDGKFPGLGIGMNDLEGGPVRVPLGSMMDIHEKSAPASSPA